MTGEIALLSLEKIGTTESDSPTWIPRLQLPSGVSGTQLATFGHQHRKGAQGESGGREVVAAETGES
jgi:hypothetical protein